MKFQTKLTLFSLGTILLVASVVSYMAYVTNIKVVEEQIKVNYKNLAQHTMENIDRMFFERLADIKMMAIDPVISSQDSSAEAITKRLIDFRDNYKTYTSLSFFDVNRVRIADTSGVLLGEQHKKVQWMRDAFDKNMVSAASDIRVSGSLKQPIIYFSAPVRDESGKTFGAVVSRVPVSKLFHIVKDAIAHSKEKNLKVNLYNKNGLLLYSNHNRKGILKDSFTNRENVEFPLESKSGVLKHYCLADDEVMFHIYAQEQGYLDFEGNGWMLVFEVSTEDLYAPIEEMQRNVVALLFPVIIFSLFLSWLLSRAISRPLSKLRDAAMKIGRGEQDVTLDVKLNDEIGQLANAFNQMSNNLNESRNDLVSVNDELKQYLSLLQATLESTADGILVVNREGDWVSSNKKFQTLWGVSDAIMDEKNDQKALSIVISQLKDQEGFLSKIKELYSQPESTSFDLIEFRDGRILERYSQPQKMGEVIVGRVWSFRDITELKRDEEDLKKFKFMCDNSNDPHYLVDRDARFVFVNNVACEKMGYSNEEFLTLRVPDVDTIYDKKNI